jgi:uncharacterized protein YkwD
MTHLIRTKEVSFFTVLLLVTCMTMACSKKTAPSATANSNSAVTASGVSDGSLRNLDKDILYYINKYRKGKGLPALQMLPAINQVATRHSSNMASRKVCFNHNGMATRVTAIERNIGRTSAAGENIAMGQMSAQEVVNMWIHSTGHRKNIEGRFNLTGIGVAKDRNGSIYYTQIFLRQ